MTFEEQLKEGIVKFTYLTSKRTHSGRKFKLITIYGTTSPLHIANRLYKHNTNERVLVYDMMREEWIPVKKNRVIEVLNYEPWFDEWYRLDQMMKHNTQTIETTQK